MKTKKKKHVRVGDRIQVIAGDQKGLIGNISSIFPKKQIVTIDTITPRLKYVKNREGGESQKVELPIPIHISNVMLWENKTNQCSRIGIRSTESEKKRYYKKSGNIVGE